MVQRPNLCTCRCWVEEANHEGSEWFEVRDSSPWHQNGQGFEDPVLVDGDAWLIIVNRVEKWVFVFGVKFHKWMLQGQDLFAFTGGANCCIFHRRHDQQDHQDRLHPRAPRRGRVFRIDISSPFAASRVSREVTGSPERKSKTWTLVGQGRDSRVKFALIALSF